MIIPISVHVTTTFNLLMHLVKLKHFLYFLLIHPVKINIFRNLINDLDLNLNNKHLTLVIFFKWHILKTSALK
jgi:hypothetical protein